MLHRLRRHRKKIWASTALLSLALILFISHTVFYLAYDGKILPGVKIGKMKFGGMAAEDARAAIIAEGEKILDRGIVAGIKGRTVNVGLREYGADPDLSRELIKYNAAKTADDLYAVGRGVYFLNNLTVAAGSLFFGKEIKSAVEFNKDDLHRYLKNQLAQYETSAENAKLLFVDGGIAVQREKIGSKINYSGLIAELELRLQNLEPLEAAAEFLPDIPAIAYADAAIMAEAAKAASGRAPFQIKYNDKSWELGRGDLEKILALKMSAAKPKFTIAGEAAENFWKIIAQDVNVPAQNAKFEMKEGRVLEFQASRLGFEFDKDATVAAFEKILNDESAGNTVNVSVRAVEPKITMDNVSNLGIADLLGAGESDFSGSPPNRIHNIKTGAGKINGLLVAPNEEFSTLRAIGPVNGETGFKKELVIKADKTTPEFGGGLCQIGTTLFRAALSSGLPITERRAHSYRVIYYEPAGVDATIYDPSPDFKFLNDTPGHILVQAYVKGAKLFFEFWGRRDGREASRTKPVVKNVIDAPPIKYIVSPDLKPGEKKKIESAHKGADAYFKYTVRYPDSRGEVSKTFSSHYKPWAEVWLVGATSTAE